MKTDVVFKQAYNCMLDLLATRQPGEALPSETALGEAMSISRTTVRKVLAELAARGYVGGDGRSRVAGTPVTDAVRFPQTETVPMSTQVERMFMEWILRRDAKPGAQINELELARQFGVGTTGIREFLNQFRRFGLIEKRPNAGWRFKGFTREFAMELFEIRELFELRSARVFAGLDPASEIWDRLRALRDEHEQLLLDIDQRFHDFSDLDNRFHRLVNAAAPNRFIDDFYDIITLIFHYHYQWNKRDERKRNEVAVREHLAYIDALLTQDRRRIVEACRRHLGSAKATMMSAFSVA